MACWSPKSFSNIGRTRLKKKKKNRHYRIFEDREKGRKGKESIWSRIHGDFESVFSESSNRITMKVIFRVESERLCSGCWQFVKAYTRTTYVCLNSLRFKTKKRNAFGDLWHWKNWEIFDTLSNCSTPLVERGLLKRARFNRLWLVRGTVIKTNFDFETIKPVYRKLRTAIAWRVMRV